MDQNSVDIPSDAGAVSSGSSIQDKLEKHMGQDTEIQPPMAESPQPKLSSAKSILVLSSILIAMFLVALDRTIIATAIPQISNSFSSLSSVGWYGSSYLLTTCALQLLFGKLYTLFPIKHILLISILLFEAASALCGAAPTSVVFIIGRALTGAGAAGIFSGVIVCIVYVVPLHRRPILNGLFGSLMGIASVAGPLIGGAFTSTPSLTWRWCFYINLPIGSIAMIIIFFILDIPDQKIAHIPLGEKLKQFDILGTGVLMPGVICLLLALQWGGQTIAWDNRRIIALFALAGVLLVAFALVQILLPKTATLPTRLFKQRSVVAATLLAFWVQCGNYIVVFFLPIWFQSIKGVSAAESGIRILPLMLSMVLSSAIGGVLTTKIGYYTPFAIIGSCILSIGAGLFTTLQIDTSAGKWVGYQIIYGIGLGLSIQVPTLAAQASLPKKDASMGISLILFGTLLGGAVFVSVGENVLVNELSKRLIGVPGINASLLGSGGATSLLTMVPTDLQITVLLEYNEALRKVFQVGLIPNCLSVLAAVSLEWRSIKKKKDKNSDADSAADVEVGSKIEL